MKRIGLLGLLSCLFVMSGYAGQPEVIKLKAPDMNRDMSVMKALQLRCSEREYSSKELELQDLSDLLWAANGINRPESGKRTAPSAMNRQDIAIYVCMEKGAYIYHPQKQELHLIVAEDLRALVAGSQDWVKDAPVALVLVSDISKFGGDEQHRLLTGAMDAGIVSQNISIFCAAAGLATVPRMSMDQHKLRVALKLEEGQYPMLNNPVGYKKETLQKSKF